jgi:hypothetical protein
MTSEEEMVEAVGKADRGFGLNHCEENRREVGTCLSSKVFQIYQADAGTNNENQKTLQILPENIM